MKVLIVSFDKTLTESLRSALSEHDVHVAKNTEEAIKMMPSDIEGVIYDAISGAISEEDINTLYTKKFSNARYVILYDELFPVDANNIIVPQKLLVPRDESPEEIVRKLEEFPVEVPQPEEEAPPQPPEEFEIETTSFEAPAVPEESVESVSESVEEALREIEEMTPQPSPEETPPQLREEEEETAPAPVQRGGGQILIVSFDQTLIDSLSSAFGDAYEVKSVKTVKQAIEEGKTADLIVFDAISGVIAEKGLIDMAGDPDLANKFYLILVDDLFPINVDNVPLQRKVAVSRDTDPRRIREIVEEHVSAPAEEKPPEQPQEQIQQPVEELSVPEVQESVPEMEITPEAPEIPEVEVEEIQPPAEEEEEIPALAALEKIIEEQKLKESEPEPEEEEPQKVPEEIPAPEPPQAQPAVSLSEEEVRKLIEEAVSRALSEERVREVFSRAVEEKISGVGDLINEAVRSELERAFEELDIRNLIRQATYQALKERLEELIS